MDKDFHKEFAKCPSCGSEDRFMEELSNELKERGIARDEWCFRYDVREGAVVDPAKEAAIPIGSMIPCYGIMTDICMNCGCIYAVDIKRTEGKKSIAPAPQPNRAMRRRDARETGGFSTS